MSLPLPTSPSPAAGQRGPAEHERRQQILEAADEHFRHYGYGKTSVTDLAKAVGVSSAYIYRFFDSKQAIGEAICNMTLGRIEAAVRETATGSGTCSERLVRIYQVLVDKGLELFFKERRLHDIVTAAVSGEWESTRHYPMMLEEVTTALLAEGRESGEFEQETPFEQVAEGVCATLAGFCHPILLEQKNPEQLFSDAAAVGKLVVRSLRAESNK